MGRRSGGKSLGEGPRGESGPELRKGEGEYRQAYASKTRLGGGGSGDKKTRHQMDRENATEKGKRNRREKNKHDDSRYKKLRSQVRLTAGMPWVGWRTLGEGTI